MPLDYTGTLPKKRKTKKEREREEGVRDALSEKIQNAECLNFVADCYKQADSFWSVLREDFLRYYQLYNNIYTQGTHNYKGRAQLFVPMVFSSIETMMPRLISNKPKTTVTPRGAEDLLASRKMDQVVSYYWDQMKMKRKLKMWVKSSLLYGTSILKLYWDKSESRPCAEILDLAGGAIVLDPQATCDEDCRYVIHTYEKDLSEIQEDSRYSNTENLGPDNWDNMRKDRFFLKGLPWEQNTLYKKALIREFWGDYDGKKMLIITANNTEVIYKKEIPYKHGELPFTRLVDTEMPNEYIGMGEVEPIEKLQYELNDTRNQRMDNVTLILNRMWKIAKGADVNESELVSQAGGVIHAADINGIQVIETPDVTRSAYNEEAMIKGDIQSVTGVNDLSPNVGAKEDTNAASSTARGLALSQEVANARLQLKLDNIDDSLTRFGNQLISLIQQYAPPKMLVRITNDKGYQWVEILKDDIQGKFDFKVEMGASQPQNRLTRRAEARELVSVIAPLIQQMPNGQQVLAKTMRFLYDTYEIPDIESVLPSDVSQLQPQQPTNPGGMNGEGTMPGEMPMQNINQSMYGAMGANLGGAAGNSAASEVQQAGSIPTGLS